MGPDRSNYEIWFTDWLDGKLSDDKVEELKLFLRQNPDLKEELDGIESVRLNPTESIFKGKKQLFKSAEDLSDSQLDYLYIASLENDLTPVQKRELNDMLDRDESRKKRFELIQKLKLKPPEYLFKNKSILKKLTIGQKLLRLSLIVSSTAAIVALAVSVYISFLENRGEEELLSSLEATADTIYIASGSPIKTNYMASAAKNGIIQKDSIRDITLNHISAELILPAEPSVATELRILGPAPDIIRVQSLAMVNFSIPERIFKSSQNQENVLVPYEPGYITPLFDDGRSNVERFVARLFHEKIMRDTISGDKPVKSYDIAVAGITGLNKLLGWEMALHKNINEVGETKSYYFSSKIIKINAPVKKADNAL
jgi:hypothetical protein